MSTQYCTIERCACGADVRVWTAECLNLSSHSEVRRDVEEGRVHRGKCPSCGAILESSCGFAAVDVGRRRLYVVIPKGSAAQAESYTTEAGKLLATLRSTDDRSSGDPEWSLAMVEGVDGLRDRVVADGLPPSERGADDRRRPDSREASMALEILHDLSHRVERGEHPDLADESGAIERMLRDLPRREHLPIPVRAQMYRVASFAMDSGFPGLATRLFALRFNTDTDSEWGGKLLAEQYREIWHILKGVPDSHVPANQQLRKLTLGGGTQVVGYEWRDGVATIVRPTDPPEKIWRSVYHEIGHAVHDARKDVVDRWLHEKFGWRMWKPERGRGLEEWIGLAGGWPDEFSPSDRERWRDAIIDAAVCRDRVTGEPIRSTFGNYVLPDELASMPGAATFPIKRLMDRSLKGNWYDNAAAWPATPTHRVSFNYMYGALVAVSDETVRRVLEVRGEHHPLGFRNYSLSSPLEFFADFYAATYGRYAASYGSVKFPANWDRAVRTLLSPRNRPGPGAPFVPTWDWVDGGRRLLPVWSSRRPR